MDNDKRLHDLIVDYLKQKLSREYGEIKVNPAGNPDLTLSSHGLVLAVVEVETEKSITPEQGERWKSLARSRVPRSSSWCPGTPRSKSWISSGSMVSQTASPSGITRFPSTCRKGPHPPPFSS
ncbi:MAG: hypothetical protein MZV70_44290 [Desulfobacterales bacterium]|nr:hypothetical protein [Desulfobacterales bacterium]